MQKNKKFALPLLLTTTLCLSALAGCNQTDQQLTSSLQNTLKKRPDIVLDVLSNNKIALATIIQKAFEEKARFDQQLAFSKTVGAGNPINIDITNSVRWGNDEAPHTIVVFSQFLCPHCQHFFDALAKSDQRDRFRIVLKHLARDQTAAFLSSTFESVCTLENANAGTLHKQWFDLAQGIVQGQDPMPKIKQIISDLSPNTDPETLFTNNQKMVAQRLEAHVKLAGTLNIPGTPTAFIDGYRFTGVMDNEMITTLLDTLDIYQKQEKNI